MPTSFMSRSWIRAEVVVIVPGNNDVLAEDEAGKFCYFDRVLPCLNVLAIQVNRYSHTQIIYALSSIA
jgi:hypothetical protein